MKDEAPTIKSGIEWQQAISWHLGCGWGSTVYTLDECVEKIKALMKNQKD